MYQYVKISAVLLIGFICSCTENRNEKLAGLSEEGERSEAVDSTEVKLNDKKTEPEISEDAFEMILFEGGKFRGIEPELNEISEAAFKKYSKSASDRKCNSNSFFTGFGLKISSDCDEICETYLVEKSTKKKLLLLAEYDQGLIGLSFSASCDKFITFSSYDGPDYADYYSERSQILGYKFDGKKGLKGVKPDFEIYFKDWSISDVIWIDNKSLALKLYTEENQATVTHYFRATIN